MGMSELRVLLRVEVPNALPLILGGLRTATLQVVATATVAAYASLGGLGRYLIDGIKVRQFHIALVGALMVAALALILDGALAFAVWAVGARYRSAAPKPRYDADAAYASKSAGRRLTWTREPSPSDATQSSWSAMLTWRAHDARRMESVRVQLSGKRIKANGRIVAAATDANPAFARLLRPA